MPPSTLVKDVCITLVYHDHIYARWQITTWGTSLRTELRVGPATLWRPHNAKYSGRGVDCGTEELCCDFRQRPEISPIPHHRDRLWGWCSHLFIRHQAKRSGPEAGLPPPPTAKAWIGGNILFTTIRCHVLWTGKLTYFTASHTLVW